MVLDSIKSVFAIMALICLGYYFTGKPWFGKPGMDFLSKFTIDVTIPFYMFYNIYHDIGTKEALLTLVKKLPVTFGMFFMFVILALTVSKVTGVSEGRRNTFVTAAGFPNVVFIGFPVIQSLWGQGVASIGVIYYIASTVLFWTVGVYFLRRDGKAVPKEENQLLAGIKKIFSPSILGMLLAMLMILMEVPVPDFVLKPLSMISGVTSPLALIFIGSVIRNMDKSELKFGRDIFMALGMRFLMVPVASVLYLRLMPIPTEMKQVFFMLSTMPAMTQMGIMAKTYECDYEFACTVIMLTTIISMLTIPLFMFFMQTFQVF